MKNALDVLREARVLITDPKQWTQGAFARDEQGDTVAPDGEAACYCSGGAILRICGGGYGSLNSEAYNDTIEALQSSFGDSITNFNDTHTHAEVLAAWDKAIYELEAAA